jgi:hypothetical protein
VRAARHGARVVEPGLSEIWQAADVNRDEFWEFLDKARALADSPDDADGVAAAAVELLCRRMPGEIAAAAQPFWGLMAESYRGDLWGAAYVVNGGASDDGFEYFRGWLISQGRTVFSQAVADPDSLAGVPAVLAAAASGMDLHGEPMLDIAWNAYQRKTGESLPDDSCTVSYPSIEFGWDFEDREATRRRLPRLSRLFLGK